MRRRLADMLRPPLSAFRRNEHVYMALIAVVIGLLGGLCAVGFRKLIRILQVVAWQTSDVTVDYLRELPAWWMILTPAAGGLLVGLIVYFFAREAKGHGVPEVMEAVALRGGRIRPRVVLAKMVASGICIASGGSVGREGPIVQIGSALGSAIGQWLGVGERRLRTLVGCGAAAGIAGTFNAPLAGALFAVEIILGDFAVASFSPIVISSVAATVVSHHFLGDFPAFVIPKYSLVSSQELFAYVALGILAGLVALAFVRMMYAFEDLFDFIPLSGPVKAVIGGMIIGLIGLRFPEILGVGYEAIEYALHAELIWHLLLILAAVKILAVSVTIGSGGSGGIFAPSLFIGAMVGGAVGTVAHSLWPTATGHPGGYALVGMGAVVAAATHAPITAILIIFELTNDYKIILPLMISCIIATLLAMQMQRASIYTLKLLRRGVDVTVGRMISVLRHMRAREVMSDEFVTVGPEDPLLAVVARFVETPGGSVFVIEEKDRLLGVITINDMRPHMRDLAEGRSSLVARDVMRESGFPLMQPGDTLDEVMRRFRNYRFPAPVVEDDRVIGAIRPQDVTERYNAEVFKREMASKMSVAAVSGPTAHAIPGVPGMSMAEIPAPRAFLYKSLGDLDIRKKYDVTVLLIKKKKGGGEELVNQVPDARYVLCAGDMMLVMGSEESLRRVERLSRNKE